MQFIAKSIVSFIQWCSFGCILIYCAGIAVYLYRFLEQVKAHDPAAPPLKLEVPTELYFANIALGLALIVFLLSSCFRTLLEILQTQKTDK